MTLKCDLHMHTVFSDGNVWPSIRVQEAIKDGLDVISITDHIEYQPHKKDLPHTDRNRSYELALEAAEGTELLVIPGTEITRSMPPGHFRGGGRPASGHQHERDQKRRGRPGRDSRSNAPQGTAPPRPRDETR